MAPAWLAGLVVWRALWSGAAAAAGLDLRPWIPVMRVRRAHGGALSELAEEYRVVVVMTTVPKRIPTLESVLDSMLRQTWPISALYLSMPHRYNRTGEVYTVPPWLKAKRSVRLVRCGDLGPGTHLLNALRLERDPWTFMVVVDDDHIYAPDLVEQLMRSALALPGSAVAAQGFLSVPGMEIEKSMPSYLQDQGFAAGPVLVSYLGVVYQRGFFDDSIFDYSSFASNCRYQDDMWFSAHLARKGIRRFVLGSAVGVMELKQLHLGPSSLTFWEENRPSRVNEECNDSLLRRFPDLWAYRRRVVLTVSGLPPFASDAPLARQEGWAAAAAALARLPRVADLTYLCSERAPGCGPFVLGEAFWLGEVLVSRSDACSAGGGEARVGRLIRDPLQWEGDPNTVLIAGRLDDVASADLGGLAECAAAKSDRPEDREAFCRAGELVAVSVGGMGGARAASAEAMAASTA